MQSKREHFFEKEGLLSHLDPEYIHHILQFAAWKTLNQSITSQETNNDNNEQPSESNRQAGENACGVDAFADLVLDAKVTRMLDVGGGKFDVCQNFMKTQGVNLAVWDPYNRSQAHNDAIERSIREKKVDAASSMAVLNVIPDCDVRLAHIATLKDALLIDGKAYFKVWPGEGPLKGSCIPTVNSYGYPGYQANADISRFLREIQIVFGLDNVQIDPNIPNLIIAIKKSDNTTSFEDILSIQTLSKTDIWLVGRKDRSLFTLHTTGNMILLRESLDKLFSNKILSIIDEYDRDVDEVATPRLN